MWTKKDVADFLKVSIRQVDVLREKHGLPSRRVGNMIRFDPEEVKQWVEKQRGN
ncbi:MAG: helix-turn-helix domain-containing protein [Thermoguttaceae bacterium]|nr:helix-turn-helix domain-containing protein [Thermoguttaceae bacterium]